jgi:two-component system, OmpR family, response regulator TctD
MRVLLTEDNRDLSQWMARTLTRDGFAVDRSYDGDDALFRFKTEAYDLLILDLDLPKIDGRSVLREVRRRNPDIPVLILTASVGLQSKVDGLNEGADDYMGKPFEMDELLARMKVLIRRSSRQATCIWTCGNLSYNSHTRQFSVGELDLALTPKEHAVLEVLMLKTGRTVSKEAICSSLYTLDQTVAPDAIEIYVHRLRKKLGDSTARILTLRGLGYLLKDDVGQ